MNLTPEFLAEYGSIGVFLGFMIYQFMQQKTELKSITQRFFDQADKIEKKYEARENDLRSRYDVIIKDYKADLAQAREERNSLRTNVHQMMKKTTDELHKLKLLMQEWQQENKILQLAKRFEKEDK